MKIFFTLALMCSYVFSMGQDDTIKIGDKKFSTIFNSSNLTIYGALCKNQEDHLFASHFVIFCDSIRQKNYLSSYNYTGRFYCTENINQSIVDQVKTLLLKKADNRSMSVILFSMKDNNNKFIAVLFLFNEKKFKKFIKEASRLKSRTYEGENMSIRDYNYKNAKEFILVTTGNTLSLISLPCKSW